jgi:AraC family transcriptional regulator of arabinose operon
MSERRSRSQNAVGMTMKSGELLSNAIDRCASDLSTGYAAKSPALGGLRDQMPDHLYALTNGRRIYTSPWLQEKPMRRCAASISVTSTSLPFRLSIGDRIEWHTACVIKPMVERAMLADNVGIVGFQFEPSHPSFPRFRRISSPGAMPLNRRVFDQFNEQFDAAYRGVLTASQASELFEAVAATAMQYLPRAKPIDKRIATIIDLLWQQHDFPLSELASRVGLSYFRLSHLFADNMGMTLRSYQQWRKIRRAISLSKHNYTLSRLAIESGFANAAHFSRAFVQLHAAPPSYFFQSGNVKIIAQSS